MKRIIKFRGLRTDGKGWVYGVPYFIEGERICFMIDNCQSTTLTQEDSVFQGKEVKYRSVGQFIGRKDKNGVDIYEGDRLIFKGNECVILYRDSYCDFVIHIIEKNWRMLNLTKANITKYKLEVIGNIQQDKNK